MQYGIGKKKTCIGLNQTGGWRHEISRDFEDTVCGNFIG